jgi:hypothetical protein
MNMRLPSEIPRNGFPPMRRKSHRMPEQSNPAGKIPKKILGDLLETLDIRWPATIKLGCKHNGSPV